MQNQNNRATGTVDFIVQESHAIVFDEPGMPAVLSTPALIWHLEHAAIEAIKPMLEPGEISVGVKVDVQHLAPTPIGMAVHCTARLLQTDGPLLSFGIEACDGEEIIARGYHQRKTVRAASIARRVGKKKPVC